MDYRELGRSGVKVSALCLGTMTWGEQNSEDDAHEQLDFAFDNGINFVDTAEIYPVPVNAETQGLTESYLGSWMTQRRNRDKVIVATKVAGRSSSTNWLRDEGSLPVLDKRNIEEAVDKSLKRLRTDYIDVYQTHWPDRPIALFGSLEYRKGDGDQEVAIEETLDAMQDLVKAGKVRHVGVSNERAWGVTEHLRAAGDGSRPRIVSIQNAYSLLNRWFEIDLSEITEREQVGLLAYSPLGQGYLSGKYLGGAKPEGARGTVYPNFPTRYTTPHATAAIEKYVALAREYGLEPAQMALQFVTMQPFVTSNIIGATRIDQLKQNIASCDLKLSGELIDAIDAIHRVQSNPSP